MRLFALASAHPIQVESKASMTFTPSSRPLRTRWGQAVFISGLLLLLSACGGDGNRSSTEMGKTATVATTTSAIPSPRESAALQAQGAALNTEELGKALAEAKAMPADATLASGQVAPLGAYKSGQVAQKAAPVQLPVFRFYNTRTGSHFFTSNTSERDAVRTHLAHMVYEGQAFLAASEASAGLKPVYRFFNTRSGLHFYTISESERANIQAHLPQFTLEGVAFYASPVAGIGLKPLYRFFSHRVGAHFYTASETERQNLLDHLGATYTYEGVGYYALTGDCALVNSNAQQATPNACYLANNAAQVNITLPASAELAVGDTLKVSGLGAGGWRILQNAGQRVETSVPGALPHVWETRGPSQNWTSVASSADGNRLIAGASNGKLYTSTDAGLNWTDRESNRGWRSVASSADGMKLIAAAQHGQIYTSDDAGVTWIPRESTREWVSVASSSDGTRLVAVASPSQVYVSSDSGATWSPRETVRNWSSVASSSDGLRLVATHQNGLIYTSGDAGATWTARASVRTWLSVASSSDGSKLVAVAHNGQIYTSSDGGITWTPRELSRYWFSVASSADGTRIAAVAEDEQIRISHDAGLTWSAQGPSKHWWGVTSSANGGKLVAAPFVPAEPLYISRTSTAPGTAGYLQGATGSVIELKYLGNGLFEVVTSSGTVSADAEPI